MFIRKFAVLALGAAALAFPLSAAKPAKADSLDEVIRKVQLAQAKTNTLQADFRQEKSLALLDRPFRLLQAEQRPLDVRRSEAGDDADRQRDPDDVLPGPEQG